MKQLSFVLLVVVIIQLGVFLTNVVYAGPYLEVGVGKNTNLSGCSICWEDSGGLGTLLGGGYKYQHNQHISTVVHWTHLSQINKGPPLSKDKESSVDHLGIKLVVEW